MCLCMQLPAGLIDAGETAAQAALRELKEETGRLTYLLLQEVECVSQKLVGVATSSLGLLLQPRTDSHNLPISDPGTFHSVYII